MKTALITGASGQDGHYMTELLRSKGYQVGALSREALKNKTILSQSVTRWQPDEIYNFAGVSNVFDPYKDQEQTLAVNGWLPQMILSAIADIKPDTKFFQASSCLVFGNRKGRHRQNWYSDRNPVYPYGAAKNYADNMVKMYREEKGLFAVSGIFFPHTSPRQGDEFFVKKVCNAAKNKQKIKLGNLQSLRDIGYAPDYMEAAYLMMHAYDASDYVIGTGVMTRMEDIVAMAYSAAGLNWKDYVETDETLVRKNDDLYLCASAVQIQVDLGWKATHNVEQIVEKMMA